MSDKLARRIMIVSAIIGLLDSIYLAYIKISHQEAICAGIGDCDVVNSSVYAEIGGFPIALLGAGAYVVLIFLLIYENREGFLEANAQLMTFGIILMGVLYSAYLTYIEIAVLHAICPYCVISAIVMVIMFIASIYRLRIYFSE